MILGIKVKVNVAKHDKTTHWFNNKFHKTCEIDPTAKYLRLSNGESENLNPAKISSLKIDR